MKVRTGERQTPNPDLPRTPGNLRDLGRRKGCRGAMWDARRHLWSGAPTPAKFIGIA